MNSLAEGDASEARGSALCLLCRAASFVCAIPLDLVSEILRPLPIAPLAGMPSFVLGLSILRGMPVPVVDAAVLLGAVITSRPARFVSMRIGGRGAVLAVEGVLGVRALARDSLERVPPLLSEASSAMIEAVGTLDADLLLLLRSGRILPDAVWAALHGKEPS